jgi:beta-fructofuranosidase
MKGRSVMDRRRFVSGACTAVAFTRMPRIFGEVAAPSQLSDLASDPRRPQFHLLPAKNWMNDPNGPVFWKGRYHMFFQYNPNAAVWGDMHWAHAVSPDMVHWRHLPVALAPTPRGPDADGCFSGTAVVHDDRVDVIYTGVVSVPEDQATLRDGVHSYRESQCFASSSNPDLLTWSKRPEPIIAAPPAGLQVTGFRDPSPWSRGDAWYMVVGSGSPHKTGAVLLYRSKDLQHWKYLHVVAQGESTGGTAANPVDSGDMWECPDLFPLSNRHVLIYSTQGKVFWQSGELDPKELVFHPEHTGLLDYGSFYAPKTQLDPSGDRLLWGWIPETRPVAEYSAAGWAGLMSLPRVLGLTADGRLTISVASAADALRQSEQRLDTTASESSKRRQIGSMRVQQACGEIFCTARRTADPFELALVSTAEGTSDEAKRWISLRYDPAQPHQISVDDKIIPVALAEGEELELHFYIDGSVIELVINRQAANTKRFYYSGSKAPEIGVSIPGSLQPLTHLSLWQLSPISADRLTT